MVEIGTVNRDLKIKIGQIAGVAEVQNILTKRNKTTMMAEVSVVKIKNCKFFDRDLKVSQFQNEFIKLLFLPKYEQKVVRISALCSESRNLDNFLFVFWEKR